MNKLNTSKLLMASVVVAVTSFSANAATVLVDNLDQPARLAPTIIPTDAGWAAQSFSTEGARYSLSTVDVFLGHRVDTPSIVAELRAGNSTNVGATLTTFTFPGVSTGSPAMVTLTPSKPVNLDPGTTYWLVMGTSGPGSFGWSYAEGNVTAGPGSLGNFAYSADSGATWVAYSDNPYHLRVNVNPVPLPASVWLLGTGLLTLLGARKKNRQRGSV